MAYALLAGMPPIYGLYAGLVPLFVYALFGSSYHLSIGPVAIISLLIFSGVLRNSCLCISKYQPIKRDKYCH